MQHVVPVFSQRLILRGMPKEEKHGHTSGSALPVNISEYLKMISCVCEAFVFVSDGISNFESLIVAFCFD